MHSSTPSHFYLIFLFLLPQITLSQDFDVITESEPRISPGLLTFDSFSNGLSNSNSPVSRNDKNIEQDKFLALEGEVFKANSPETALDLATRAEEYFRTKFLAHPVSHSF